MQLIPDIKKFYKFLSVQVTVIGGALVAAVVADPVTASTIIGGIVAPAHMPFVTIGLSVITTLVARAKAQPTLDENKDNEPN